MPHLSVECAGLSADEAQALVGALHGAMAASGLFETGAIRVRAFRADAAAVADLHAENAFADMVLRMGAGRAEGDRRALGAALMAAAEAALAPRLAAPHFALSLEIVEIGGLSWKTNTIHPRLRGSRP